MPTLTARTKPRTRRSMELLAERPDGLHFSELWKLVVEELPLADEDMERLKSGDTKGENAWKWQTSDLVMAGWLRKNNGYWRITALGREALEQHSDAEAFYGAARSAYAYWEAHRHGFAYAQKLVGVIPAGRQLDLDTLAAETRLDRGPLARWLWGARPKGAQWVVDGSGGAAPEVRADDTEKAELFAEIQDWQRLAEETVRPIELRELQELLARENERVPHAPSAWLLHGYLAHDADLVRAWITEGFCSLNAALIGPVDGSVSPEELRVRVEHGYRSVPASRREELASALLAFLSHMHPGDLVCTLSDGRFHLGTVTGPAEYKSGVLRRTVNWMDVRIDYNDLPEEVQGRFASQHDIVDMTSLLNDLLRLAPTAHPDDDSRAEEPEPEAVGRTGSELPAVNSPLADELLITEDWLTEVRDLLQDRQQLIFYGPPGTGKTYLAQHIAEHLAGDPRAVKLVQFHPSYAYEDFFEGFRPVITKPEAAAGTGTLAFDLRPGPFRKLVDLAEADPSTPYFLIIDEINRANLAKVFGELYFVLEYRNRPVDLQYSGEFHLPRNVFIIGTMNTADRSIALVDAAMRRRFAFVALHPDEEPTDGMLARWIEEQTKSAKISPTEDVAALHRELNRRIEDKDFRIGPSYLMRPSVYAPGGLERVWRTSILPLLEEHHYGDDSVNIQARYGLAALRRAVSGGDA
ncbi:AAA family ATPase [Streptomyces werraensis]|uniref:AAA family ATPase n=1 Tax=Streptomyces werraensis TaxID=68284 RepID=UPI0037F6750C